MTNDYKIGLLDGNFIIEGVCKKLKEENRLLKDHNIINKLSVMSYLDILKLLPKKETK